MPRIAMQFVGGLCIGGGISIAFLAPSIPASVVTIAGAILWAAVYMKD